MNTEQRHHALQPRRWRCDDASQLTFPIELFALGRRRGSCTRVEWTCATLFPTSLEVNASYQISYLHEEWERESFWR
jgi:hypothetical protein